MSEIKKGLPPYFDVIIYGDKPDKDNNINCSVAINYDNGIPSLEEMLGFTKYVEEDMKKNMKIDVRLRFEDFSLVHERIPFPIVYMTHDSHDLTVWFKIFITFSQENEGLTIDKIKSFVSQIIDIDEWEVERDISSCTVELYGIKKLLKPNVRIDYDN